MTTTIDHQTLDVPALRADFPLLRRTMHGKPLVYLDSAATSQKPRQVLDALHDYYATANANVHRGVYELAEEATAAYEGARAAAAAFLGATPEETIFTRNATEGINLVAYTWGRSAIRRGDLIAVTPLEHHSNLVPWQILAAEVGAELAYLDLHADGSLDLDSLDRILANGRVKLVASTYISNVLGTIAPVKEIARRAHAHGVTVLIDAAQAAPHLPVDVRDLNVDFLVFTAHKMLGPMGIGVLYGRRTLLEAMPPFLGGGEMIRHVGAQRSTWNDLPWKFEAGTPSVGDAVGLHAAIDYLGWIGMESIAAHDRQLASYAAARLGEIPGVTVYGPEERGAVAAFSVEDIHAHDLASLLDEQGIAVRAGHHCAQPLHDLLGVPATTRASFYLYNDERDVDQLIDGIDQGRRVLGP
ncbi:MAG TPA: SufS family cysteine desulfurase [Chloroflexota bacterium]|nr:SufS family cysteine desulfurase [Chloroflexota bacterium]